MKIDAVDSFICRACGELLFEPVPLPCGNLICHRCFRIPKRTDMEEAALSVGAFNCPARDCGKTHRHRKEGHHTLINNLLLKLFPNEQNSLFLAKQGEEHFKKESSSNPKSYFKTIPNSNFTPNDTTFSLSEILQRFLNPAIDKSPFLQLPLILRSKVLAEMGHYKEARMDSRRCHDLNPTNKRGIVSEKLVGWVQQFKNPETLNQEQPCPLGEMRSQLVSACQGICASVCISKSKQALLDTFSKTIDLIKIEDLDCQLCLEPMGDPVTTPCGHSFCRNCLLSSLNHSKQCPLCRSCLPSLGFFANHPSDKAISNILEHCFGKTPSICCSPFKPIFGPNWIPIYRTNSLFFPNSETSFHICEMGYRVMVKRIIETNGLFGVMLPPCGSGVEVTYGTLVKIVCFEPLLSCDIVGTCDGNLPRYVIKVQGLSRFRVDSLRMNPGGYEEGFATRIEDVEPEQCPNWDPKELEALVCCATSFIKRHLDSVEPCIRKHYQSQFGDMPKDPSELTYWLAGFLPANPYVLYQIMPLNKVCDRLRLLCRIMESMK